jgi:DNA-binding transcriptional regulator GbsR (MarR family)
MKPLTEPQRDLVERIGVLHDQMGLRPAAGRVLGMLIVAEEGELTFDELRDELGLSKSATSTALQMLQDVGSVTYRTRPGDRRRYFRKNVEDWEARFIERTMHFLEIRHLLAEAITARGAGTDEALERMVGFLDRLAETIQATHDEWRSRTTDGAELTAAR